MADTSGFSFGTFGSLFDQIGQHVAGVVNTQAPDATAQTSQEPIQKTEPPDPVKLASQLKDLQEQFDQLSKTQQASKKSTAPANPANSLTDAILNQGQIMPVQKSIGMPQHAGDPTSNMLKSVQTLMSLFG